MPIEVGCRKERRRPVLHQRLLVGFRSDPEDDDVRVSLTCARVDSIWPRRPEEDERLAPDLVDRVVLRSVDDRDVRHRRREGVDVLDPSPRRHRVSVCGCWWSESAGSVSLGEVDVECVAQTF